MQSLAKLFFTVSMMISLESYGLNVGDYIKYTTHDLATNVYSKWEETVVGYDASQQTFKIASTPINPDGSPSPTQYEDIKKSNFDTLEASKKDTFENCVTYGGVRQTMTVGAVPVDACRIKIGDTVDIWVSPKVPILRHFQGYVANDNGRYFVRTLLFKLGARNER